MMLPLFLAIAPMQTAPTSVNPFAGPHAEKTYTYAVSGPARLAITTLNGRITVKRGDAGKIVVTVNRRAGTQTEVDALGSEVQQKDSTVSASGTFPPNCGDSCGSVDFIVTVPADTSITAHSDNGEIGINDIDGTVTASTKTGPILCGGLAGNVTLGAVHGMVNAGFRDFAHVTKVILGTSDGVVRLVLPHGATIGTLKAGTGDGKIYSPFDLKPVSKGNGVEVSRQFSATGPTVLMGTGRGDVNIVTESP